MSRHSVKKNTNKPGTPQTEDPTRSGVFHSDTPQSPHEPSKARDRVTLKNTRDGIVERNAATGEDIQISRREEVFDLRNMAPSHENALNFRGDNPAQDAFSQVGKNAQPHSPQANTTRKSQKASRRYQDMQSETAQDKREGGLRHTETQTSVLRESEPPSSLRFDDTQALRHETPQTADSPSTEMPVAETPRYAPQTDGGSVLKPTPKSKPSPSKATQYKQGAEKPTQADTSSAPHNAAVTEQPAEPAADTALNHIKPVKLKDGKPDARLYTDSHGRLQFSPDETAPDTPKITHNRKLTKAQAQMDKVSGKLEKAQGNLPAKRKFRKINVTDEKSGTVKRKLRFEKTPISQGEHIKGALPLRPVKAAGNSLMLGAHRKIYQVEHENVSIKAAHRAEMLGEAGVRTALRMRKTAPFRKVAKLERAAAKKSVKLTHQRMLAQNPKLKSNVLTRALQKRKIKKDYAKAAREAKKAAEKAKQAGSAVTKVGKAIIGFVKRHPFIAAIIIIIALLLFAVMSLISAFSGAATGSMGSIAASTYLAEDAEMYAAQAAYAGMEADLQYQLDNYALLNPGYDEYVFELDQIWHDPYVLMSILSALHEGAWTLADVQGTLAMLFERQYILTETVTTETRYRAESASYTDPVTGDVYDVTEYVPYDHYITTVTLENFNLSHLPIYIMGEDSLSRYALFTATLGNRPDLFPVGVYPHASYYKEFLRYDIPPEYLADETFAAMIAEANKYLGMPYVWGGYNPRTSFDCSGYVSWVINNSGWNVGRLGAQGLYNICTTVSAADAKPGDLVFFHSTYRATHPVTHVGIYVGDGMMVHCGDPIGYVSLNTTYWQNHLYGYGRLPAN